MKSETWKEIDWPILLSEIGKLATSETAREKVRNIGPLSDAKSAKDEMHNTFKALQSLSGGTRPQLEPLDYFVIWFERIKKGATLNAHEFRDVRRFCYGINDLRKILEAQENDWQKETLSQLVDSNSILSAIDQIITEDGGIRTDASELLFSLFNEKNQLEGQIRKTLDRIVKDFAMESILQDRYVTTRDGRWVLPVKSGMRSGINGIIHDISQTKQTVFMEPQEVVEVNNRLRQVISKIEEEVERILKQLSAYLFEQAEALQNTFEVAIDCDCKLAIAEFSDRVLARPVTFGGDKVQLNSLRHPLLSLKNLKGTIPNDLVYPNEKSILVLSGPNAGGKTVLLKSLGLAVQMSRCGLPICCGEGSEIPFIKNLVVDVGDSQSVGENLSTFAAHLKALTKASEAQGHESLVLIDEICGSTDPEEGSALARSFVEHFAKSKVFGLITSHLGPLKQGWEKHNNVVAASMEYDEASHKATYELVMGIHGRSFAIKTAKVVGVPNEIVERAISFLDPEVRKRELAIDDVETLRQETVQLRAELRKELAEADKQKQRYRELVEKFRHERDEWMKKAIQKGQDKIDEAVRLQQRDKLNVDFRSFKAEMPNVIKSTGNVRRRKARNVEEFIEMFPPGTKAFVISLNQTAIVQSTPNGKGDVSILSNSMRLAVNWNDIETINFENAPQQEPSVAPFKKTHFVDTALTGGVRTVDVRGQTVEVALNELEIALDQAILASEDRVKIIHGHGTEVLKKAIRSYLSRSVYVKKWVAGDKEIESDGITWAEI